MPTSIKPGSTAADFAETGLDRKFSERDFGGRLRANESSLAAIEKSIEWMLWKRSLLDSHGTCKVVVANGTFRRDETITWNVDFSVMKGSKKIGKGLVMATLDGKPLESALVLRDVHAKVYADQRDRIARECGEH